MAAIFIRTLIMYIFIMISMRLMGKRQMGQLQPSELVVTIMISELAALPIQDSSTSLLLSIVSIITLITAEIIVTFLTLKSNAVRKMISGSPSILVQKGKINQREMQKQRFNVDDLMEELRINSVKSLSEVDYVILETNGMVSVIPNSISRPVTPKDINLNPPESHISYMVIDNGKINYANLRYLGFNQNWLERQLKKYGVKTHKKVFYMSADKNGDIFLVEAEK